MAGTYETACRGKDRHRTYAAAANQAVKHGQRPSLASNKKLSAYKCDFCGWYHVGNSTRLKRQPYRRHKIRRQW